MFKANKEQRQYLNLSKYAKDIIDSYCYGDGEYNVALSAILNRILDNFMESADASISLRLRDKEADLQSMIGINPSEDTKELIQKIIKSHEERLIHKNVDPGYPKDQEKIDFRLNNNNYNKIYTNYCKESEYYKKGSDYIKAVIEEFTRKAFHEREAIIYHKTIQCIQSAINKGNRLKIKTRGLVFNAIPYKIVLDEQHGYNYLAAKSAPYLKIKEFQKGTEIIASFRISRIDEISEIKSDAFGKRKLTNADKFEIEKKISKVGIMFLLGAPEKTIIGLSEIGAQKYKTRIKQRPRIEPISDSALIEYHDQIEKVNSSEFSFYTVKSTKLMASNYFFDFGKDVIIISPLDLKNEFKKRYEEAAAQYK